MDAILSVDNRETNGLDAPPSYGSSSINDMTPALRGHGAHPSSQIFEENEFGEMQPVNGRNGATSRSAEQSIVQQVPSDTVYTENEFGEIHREESDPEVLGGYHRHRRQQQQQQSSPIEINDESFGKDTQERSAVFRSDAIYPENRFGELGRADTFAEHEHEHVHLAEKLKEKAEHIVDKLTMHRHQEQQKQQHRSTSGSEAESH